MRALIEMGVELQPQAADGARPLHLAADSGQCEVIRTLVELGADVNALGDNKTRPLHCACAKGRVGAMQLLIDLGADVEVQADDGARPLHLSSMFGHCEAIKALIDMNADLHSCTSDGAGALHCGEPPPRHRMRTRCSFVDDVAVAAGCSGGARFPEGHAPAGAAGHQRGRAHHGRRPPDPLGGGQGPRGGAAHAGGRPGRRRGGAGAQRRARHPLGRQQGQRGGGAHAAAGGRAGGRGVQRRQHGAALGGRQRPHGYRACTPTLCCPAHQLLFCEQQSRL